MRVQQVPFKNSILLCKCKWFWLVLWAGMLGSLHWMVALYRETRINYEEAIIRNVLCIDIYLECMIILSIHYFFLSFLISNCQSSWFIICYVKGHFDIRRLLLSPCQKLFWAYRNFKMGLLMS